MDERAAVPHHSAAARDASSASADLVEPSQHVSDDPAQSRETRRDEGGVKETIEQILVAFILAFIFRAFIVEAFVIPTGSMAPTLLGAHMRFLCEDCGYHFDTNYNATGTGDDLNIPTQSTKSQINALCPNCGFRVPNAEPGDQAFLPFVRYGDRILVLKYLYLFEEPRRWDVVVFKSPDNPKAHDYAQNYIKRLIGRPNESVMILDGDIYAGSPDAQAQDMRIQPKPRDVQQALWRIVYDNDHYPRKRPRDYTGATWRQPWTPRNAGAGWNLLPDGVQGRTFAFNNERGGDEIFFDDQANLDPRFRRGSSLFDWLAYDVESSRALADYRLVGDLKLALTHERLGGDGPLRLMLSKRGVTFTAEIGPTSARLLRTDGDGRAVELIPPVPIAAGSGPRQLEFTNVDYQVALRVDGREVLRTTPEMYSPDIASLLAEFRQPAASTPGPAVRIGAENQQCRVSHLSLWRDIAYINLDTTNPRRSPVTPHKDIPFSGAPDNIMRLGDDEYFVLGDNSQLSGDGRYWNDPAVLPYELIDAPAGRVPGRFMLGKAFFVYWPAGFRPFGTAPPLVPNFGDMRFIH